MSISEAQLRIAQYSELYQRLTGFELRATRGVYDFRERVWFEFAKLYSLDELALVIKWLQRKIKDGKRNTGALRFSNLIEQIDLFGEELGMAKAEMRNQQPQRTPKDIALSQLRPAVTEPRATGDAKPIGEYIAALRKAVNEHNT